MVTLLLKASHKDECSVVRFFVSKITAQMPFTLRPAIRVWCKKFSHGRGSVRDEKRPGRCVVSTSDAAIAFNFSGTHKS